MAGGAQARIHTTVALSPSFLTPQASVSFNRMLTTYPVLGSWVSRLRWRCALGVWLTHRGALGSTPGEGRRQDQAGEGGAATQSTAPAGAAVVSCASDEGGGPWVRRSLKVALPVAGGESPPLKRGPRGAPSTADPPWNGHGATCHPSSPIPFGPGMRNKGQGGAEGGRRRPVHLHGPMEVAPGPCDSQGQPGRGRMEEQ